MSNFNLRALKETHDVNNENLKRRNPIFFCIYINKNTNVAVVKASDVRFIDSKINFHKIVKDNHSLI